MLTQEDRSKGGKAAAVARTRSMMERARRAEVIHRMVSELDDLAPAALERTLAIIESIDPDVLPVENWLDAKRAIDVAEASHRISRLASGQSTANVAHANMSDDERRERMAQLRAIAEANANTNKLQQ